MYLANRIKNPELKHGFDPTHDLAYDARGVIQLVGKPALEQALRVYNRSRFEDSIEET